MVMIIENFGDNIEEFPAVQVIITEQFNLTSVFYYKMLCLYVLGFATPYSIQIFLDSVWKSTIIGCNVICMLTMTFFFYLEGI